MRLTLLENLASHLAPQQEMLKKSSIELVRIPSFLSEYLQSAAIGLGEMVTLIITISLGVLLGTLIISPRKFVPITATLRELES
jgi:hypothetical protein